MSPDSRAIIWASPGVSTPRRGRPVRAAARSTLLAIGLVLGLAGAATAATNLIRGSVVGSGGASWPPGTGGAIRLHGTVGQPAIGVVATPNLIVCSGFWCFGGPRVLAVDPPVVGSAPAEFALGPATPNPTREQAHFRLALPRAAMVDLSVFDVGGRQIGETVSRRFEAGEHDLMWRAADARPGVYFMRLEADGVLKAKRTIVLVR